MTVTVALLVLVAMLVFGLPVALGILFITTARAFHGASFRRSVE